MKYVCVCVCACVCVCVCERERERERMIMPTSNPMFGYIIFEVPSSYPLGDTE